MVGVVGLMPPIETVKPAGDTADGGPSPWRATMVPPTPPLLVHGPPEILCAVVSVIRPCETGTLDLRLFH